MRAFRCECNHVFLVLAHHPRHRFLLERPPSVHHRAVVQNLFRFTDGKLGQIASRDKTIFSFGTRLPKKISGGWCAKNLMSLNPAKPSDVAGKWNHE